MQEKQNKTTNIILSMLISIASVSGFDCLYRLRGASTMLSNSTFGVVVFCAVAVLTFQLLKEKPDKRAVVIGAISGFFFSAMVSWGFSLHYNNTIWLTGVFEGWILIWPLMAIGVSKFLMIKPSKLLLTTGGEPEWKISDRRFMLTVMLIIFVSWIPVWAASWPGNFKYDYGMQMEQYLAGTITTQHPFLHTFMLGICRTVGESIFGQAVAGSVLYILIQTLIMSACYGYVISYIRKRGAKKTVIICTIVFFAVHPTSALMAITAIKDSVFGALFAVFVVEVIEMERDREVFFSSVKKLAVFGATLLLLCAFRKNAWQMLLASIPFFMIIYRRFWKKMGLLLLICVCIHVVYTGPIYRAIGIISRDSRAYFNVPMQQLARSWMINPDSFSEEEREIVFEIIPQEGLESYLPTISDPVKSYFNGRALDGRLGQFFRVWASIGMKNKKVYVDAFLVNTYGFWYPGNTIHDSEKGRIYFEYGSTGYNDEVDVKMMNPIPPVKNLYRQVARYSVFQNIPVVSVLFNQAIYLWILLLSSASIFYRKRYRSLMVVIPPILYFGTLLLGPTVTVRYVFYLFAIAPVLILDWALSDKE